MLSRLLGHRCQQLVGITTQKAAQNPQTAITSALINKEISNCPVKINISAFRLIVVEHVVVDFVFRGFPCCKNLNPKMAN